MPVPSSNSSGVHVVLDATRFRIYFYLYFLTNRIPVPWLVDCRPIGWFLLLLVDWIRTSTPHEKGSNLPVATSLMTKQPRQIWPSLKVGSGTLQQPRRHWIATLAAAHLSLAFPLFLLYSTHKPTIHPQSLSTYLPTNLSACLPACLSALSIIPRMQRERPFGLSLKNTKKESWISFACRQRRGRASAPSQCTTFSRCRKDGVAT